LRVPEDIAVAGFDDIRLARFACPPLTTVHEPDIEHGRRAGELLISLINGELPDEAHVRLEAELVVRESCGAAVQRPSA
jgi:DNA-binding LacI/PurR family transcriptional regulator